MNAALGSARRRHQRVTPDSRLLACSVRRSKRLAAYTELFAARRFRCAGFRQSHLGFDIGDMSPIWAQYCVHLVSLIAKVDAMLDQCDFDVPNAGA